jgi:hypothetical protein
VSFTPGLEVAEKKQVPAYAIFSAFLQLPLFTVQKIIPQHPIYALPQVERSI